MVERAELEFPGQEPGGQPGRTAVERVDLRLAGPGADVAVLDLGEDRPGWLPAPVPVWPAARPPGRVQVFGYPLAEGPLKGVWRQFTVAGPATAGTVQLDWLGEAGTFPGHSGGPVIDAAGDALAGILVEGAERERFDRFVPVALITRMRPQLPRPWLMTGALLGEARSHFTRRARGQRSAARGGDLFRGRAVALERVRGWLTADEPPGQPLVVTGQPGAGKSAVLARAALSLEAGHGGPGLAFHARGAIIGGFLEGLRQFTAALLAQDGMDHPSPPGAAWTQYRVRHGICDRLAAVTAQRAGRNFLAAAMAAVPLSTALTAIDPAAKGFDPAGLPSGVGEALSNYLDRLPDQRPERDRELLTALAYARGAGLDDPAWLAFRRPRLQRQRRRSRWLAPFSGRRLPAPDHDD